MFYENNTHYTSFGYMLEGEKDLSDKLVFSVEVNMFYENNTHYTSFSYMLHREKDLNDKLVI